MVHAYVTLATVYISTCSDARDVYAHGFSRFLQLYYADCQIMKRCYILHDNEELAGIESSSDGHIVTVAVMTMNLNGASHRASGSTSPYTLRYKT